MSEFKLIPLGDAGAVCEGGVCAVPETAAKPDEAKKASSSKVNAKPSETTKPK